MDKLGKTPSPADRGAVEALQRNMRDAFEAMCAMRDSINEYIPMPSLESDLLQGPETSVFCATVAEAVIAALALPAAEVKAKPLEWHGPDYEGEYWAPWIGGKYTILAENGNGHWLGGVGGYFPTIADAKAAAQADYEERILSALAAPSQAREGE